MTVLQRAIGLLPLKWIKLASELQWRHPIAKTAFDAVANRMRNSDGTILRGAGKGLRFNTGRSVAGFMLGTTEPGLQRAFLLFVKPKMNVYDVGANVGYYSVIAARLTGPEGSVFAFEPLEENLRTLRHNVTLNGFRHVHLMPLALGNIDGDAQFNVSSDPNWGKLASIGVPGASVGQRPVQVARIDTLIQAGRVAPPDLIKKDVEGAETEALEGAFDTLKRSRPVLFIDLHGTNGAVESLLARAQYDVRVLGGRGQKVTEALWSAEIIAVPSERHDLKTSLQQMAEWSLQDTSSG